MINDSNIKLSTDEFLKIFKLFKVEEKMVIRQSINREFLKKE